MIAGGRWFTPAPPVSSTNITDDIAKILFNVALNTITLTLETTKKDL